MIFVFRHCFKISLFMFILSSIFMIISMFFYKMELNRKFSFKLINSQFDSLMGQNYRHQRFRYLYECNPFFSNDEQEQYSVDLDGQQYPRLMPSYLNKKINFDCLNSNNIIKRILLWNMPEKWNDLKFGMGAKAPFIAGKCPVVNCELTDDKSNLKASDLVVVNLDFTYKQIPERSQDDKKTRWTFIVRKSPFHFRKSLSRLNGKFDFSSTYRFDSYFTSYFYSYSNLNWNLNDEFDLKLIETNVFRQKSDLVAAYLDKCESYSKRYEYIQMMRQAGLNVSIYGNCGNDNQTKSTIKSQKELKQKIIYKKYKFFLAFEESICEDFVTDLFFDLLPFNIIPIVFDYKQTYGKYVPKSAYINALDFKTPSELNEFIFKLGKDPVEYGNYFKWKKHVKFDHSFGIYCDMCIKLNLERYLDQKAFTVRNFKEYWKSDEFCLSPTIINNQTFSILRL